MVAPGGQTLAGHVSGGSLDTIRNGDWDVVVIQDQSQRPSFGPGYVFYEILPDVIAIKEAIRETNPCTLPLYFMTWGKRDGDTGNCNNGATALCTFEGVQVCPPPTTHPCPRGIQMVQLILSRLDPLK